MASGSEETPSLASGDQTAGDSSEQQSNTQLSESRNYGYEVLVHCGVQVTQGLSRDPKTAASHLHSRGLVSDRLLEEITDLNVTRSDNGRKLYTAVLDVVKCFPHRYRDFISVLNENSPLYGDLLSSLREAYNEADPSAQENDTSILKLTVSQNPSTESQTECSPQNEVQAVSPRSSLKSTVSELEKAFRLLAKQTFEYLSDHSVTVESFKGGIACMGVELRASTSDYLEECFGKLSPTSQLSDLWFKLTSLWDFLNFEFLEHTIEIFIPTDHSLHHDLCTYIKRVTDFSSKTKVCDFFQAWPFRTKKPKEAKVNKMVVKAERSWEECTLQDIKETTNTLAHLFSLPRSLLLLRDVEEGCVSILWYVPPSVADSIERGVAEVKPETMSDNGFLSITIDDLQVYPLTPGNKSSRESSPAIDSTGLPRQQASQEKSPSQHASSLTEQIAPDYSLKKAGKWVGGVSSEGEGQESSHHTDPAAKQSSAPLSATDSSSLHLKNLYEQKMISKKSAKKLLMPFKLALITKWRVRSNDKYSLSTLRGDKDDIHYQKSPTDISSLGTLPDGSPARLVLLEGAPGSGKTTFCLDAVLKWMRKEILTDISLLALFPLRDYNLKKVTTLLELLALISPVAESLLEELKANKGEGVAFLFDGWDEIASSLDSLSPIFKQLVSGEILDKARVYVASRSWATRYIKMLLDKRPSQHMEIVSSARDQIDWLLTLKKQELPTKFLSTLDKFLTYLEETPAIRGNMHTPLATDITLEVYQWSQESGSPLPTTVTQLYASYTCLCIHKYLDNHSHFESKLWKSNDMRDIPEPLRTWLFSLCRLAFDGLEDGQRLVFPDVPSGLRLETLGLMQAQAPLYGSEEHAVVSYHYKHLTLQEFLGALLLSWIPDEERREIVESCVSDGRFQIMLRCVSGLTRSPHITRDHMRRMLDSKEDKDKSPDELRKESKDKLTIFHWLFEGGDKASTADILGEREMRVRPDYTWSSLDLFIVGHSIAHSKCPWNIVFSDSPLGDEKMTEFLQALGSADGEQGNAYITSLNWSLNDLTSQSLCHLQDIPARFLRHLKSFSVSYNNLDRTAVDHIAKTIPHMPQLEELDLIGNRDIQRGGAVSLVSALYDHKALKNLDLSCTNIGEEDCEQLAQLLSSSQFLKKLDVGGNSLSSDSVHILFKALQQNSSLTSISVWGDISLEAMKTLSAYLQDKEKCKLETLDLSCCHISSDTAVELAHGLSRNCSVKELNLSGNPNIGDEGAAALGQAMTENKTITKIELARCGITSTGGAALASSLILNSTIEELNINDNSLGGAIPTIAQLLDHNKSLKGLYILDDDSLSQSDVNTLLNSLTNNQTLEELTLPEKFRVVTDKRVVWVGMY